MPRPAASLLRYFTHISRLPRLPRIAHRLSPALALGAALLACAPAAPTPGPSPLATLPPQHAATPKPSATTTADAPPPSASSQPPAQPPAQLPEMEISVSLALDVKAPEPACPCGAAWGFHPLDGKLLFQVERHYLEWEGHRFVQRPAFARGFPPRGFTATTFFGQWPASAFVQLRDDASFENEETRSVLYRWSKDRWQKQMNLDRREQASPWYPGDGSVGMVRHAFSSGSSENSVVMPLDPGSGVPRPTLARGPQGTQHLAVKTSASLPSGHLFVLGVAPHETSFNAFFVERFGPGATTGISEPLPMSPPRHQRFIWESLVARSPSEVYALGVFGDPPENFYPTASYLARFDGARWQRLDAPQGLWAPRAALTDDGSLWIVNDTFGANPSPPSTWTSMLLRRSPSGEWSQVRLRTPAGILGQDILLSRICAHDGALWLMGFPEAQRDRTLVWTTAQVDKPWLSL